MCGKTLLITAGPTREYIDPVRFISNISSGKIGYEVAKEFSKNGYNVILISGPTNIAFPKNVKVYKVETSDQMFKLVRKFFPKCNLFISTAAVCDFKPAKMAKQKIKKRNVYSLKLISTVDILKYCGTHKKNNQVVIGFALETDHKNAISYAKEKLKNKNLDVIVLNFPNTFGSRFIKPTIIYKNYKVEQYSRLSKNRFSKILFKVAENLLGTKNL